MYNLAFDTTGAQCAVILRKDEKTLDLYSKFMDFGQADELLPQIKRMLEGQNLTFADLSLVAVCTGPGSFTGVRASISAARAFSIACSHLAVDGVSAFDAYVEAFHPEELAEANIVIIETKREDFYFQIYDHNRNKITSPQAAVYEDIMPLLRHKKVSITGDGVERFLSRPTGLSLHCIKMPEALDITNLAQVACRHFNNKQLDFPKPLYLRAPDVSMPKGQS